MENQKIDWKEVNPEILRKYLETTPTKVETKIWVSLYQIYEKITKLENNQISLDELENRVYMVDQEEIKNPERIKIEIARINETLKRNNKYRTWVEAKLKNINNTYNKNTENDASIEFYIKKEIVRLQALLGLNITFFKAAKETFLEEIRNTKVKELDNENIAEYIKKR